MPFGFWAFNLSSAVLKGTISVYTFASRILRPISCVYCPPKSRMSIVSNFDDILPHYSNRGEPHEQQVAVQKVQKKDRKKRRSEHSNRIRRTSHVGETCDKECNERRSNHTF